MSGFLLSLIDLNATLTLSAFKFHILMCNAHLTLVHNWWCSVVDASQDEPNHHPMILCNIKLPCSCKYQIASWIHPHTPKRSPHQLHSNRFVLFNQIVTQHITCFRFYLIDCFYIYLQKHLHICLKTALRQKDNSFMQSAHSTLQWSILLQINQEWLSNHSSLVETHAIWWTSLFWVSYDYMNWCYIVCFMIHSFKYLL